MLLCSASGIFAICSKILQRGSNAPIAAQGRAGPACRPDCRSHAGNASSGRPASPIFQSVSFRQGQGCFQSSLALANASSDPGKVTGPRWPQPSMPGPFRQVYLDVKGEQSLEQLGLTIKMMLAKPAPWNLFAAVFE